MPAIRPTPADLKGTPGAWYGRISDDESKQDIRSQREELQRWLDRHGLTVDKQHQYEDAKGYTPRHRPDDRPAWVELMKAVRAGLIKWVVVWQQTRIGGRDEWHYASIINQFREHGVQVWTTDDDLLSGDDALTFFQGGVKAGSSKEHQHEKSKGVLRGMMAKCRRGEWTGGYVPYALDVVCLDKSDREKWRVRFSGGHYQRTRIYPDGTMERFDGKGIFPATEHNDRLYLKPGDPARLEVVRTVFELFANQSISTYQIARRLNDLGIRPTYGERWLFSHVRTILANPVYLGKPTYNKHGEGEFFEDFGDGAVPVTGKYTRRRDRPQSAWVTTERPIFDPIIGKRTWDKVQTKLADQTAGRKQRAPKNPALWLADLMVCDGCGKRMRGQMRPHYAQYSCSTYDKHKNNPTGCLRNAINQQIIEDCLARYLDECGTTVDILREVGRTGDTALLQTLEDRLVQAWDQYANTFDRVGQFVERYHDYEDPAGPEFIGVIARRHTTGKQVVEFQPRAKAQRALLARLYSVVRDGAESDIKKELAALEAKRAKLARECKRLPDGSRSLKAEQTKLLAIEADMERLEADLADRSADLDRAATELEAISSQIEKAKRAIGSDGDLRARSEAVRQVVKEIRIKFVPTGKKYPTSRAVEMTITPVFGAEKKYRNDDSGLPDHVAVLCTRTYKLPLQPV